ncbi:MAG: penicillin-binding protein 2, partial [Betaproteobacteria bacterium]|nr:penicillin-binding protein 2 [Betaproteobacteria bacterium]
DWDALGESPQKPLVHRAIYGQYAPGSTIKPFFALAALEHGWRDRNYIYHSRGYFQLGSHKFRDWKEGGHGKVDIIRSIVRSVNSFYYTLGHEVGVEKMHDGLSVFGFGEKSGVDLDGEKSGVLPNAAWKKKQYNQEWFPGDTISASVGQGYVLVTPLQMAAAMGMIANGGKQLRPRIRRTDTGAVRRQTKFSPEHLSAVRGALAAVTKPGGTAPRVGRGIKYGIAGKTGTAQVSKLRRNEAGDRIKNKDLPKHLRDDAWFVGYAPAKNPRVAVAVVVENSGSGGRVAGPIARELVAAYMKEYAPPYRPLPPHAEGA